MSVEPARPEHAQPGNVQTQGGDPVCWAHLLCPTCGAMPESTGSDGDQPGSTTCWRCGEEREQ